MTRPEVFIAPSLSFAESVTTTKGFADQVTMFNDVFSTYYEYRDSFPIPNPLPLDQTVSMSRMLLSIICRVAQTDFSGGKQVKINVADEAYMLFPSSPDDLTANMVGLEDVFNVYYWVKIEEADIDGEEFTKVLQLKSSLVHLLCTTFLEYDWIRIKEPVQQ